MCGLCGYRSEHPIDLEKMSAVLAHRGPDDSGTYRSRDVGLGHRRLSVIDLKTGHQPMMTDDKQIVLVYNGEIYNFLELKKALQGEGYFFKTTSDTEVLLLLYERYGTDCLRHLNGEFAFVLFDRRKNILFGARDRLGIKPLYYSLNDKGFFFASEIKALFETGYIQTLVNKTSVDLYFTYRYIPGQSTIYRNIFKLLPGHAFIQSADLEPKFWKYWDLPREEEPILAHEASKRFEELLVDSVNHRLISDVPLGVFLSGGIDSSALIAIMAKLNHRPLRSYTAGFQSAHDETKEAAETACRYSSDHHALMITPDAFNVLEKILWHMDEPFGDAIVITNFCLSREAARQVKVVLTGDGADEGQMGYVHHESLNSGLAFRRWPLPLLKAIGCVIPLMPVSVLDRFFHYPISMGPQGKNRLAKFPPLLRSPGQAYQHFCSLFTHEERERLYGPALKSALSAAQESFHAPLIREMDNADDPLRAIYLHDLKHWLPDNILNKQDRMTMAHSLEGRVPYLDHRLIEFEARLPLAMKLRNGHGKYLLKSFYHNRVAPQLRQRKQKKAFVMPLDGQYHRAYRSLVEQYLNDAEVDGELFNKGEIRSIVKAADVSPLLGHKKVMSLIMFQVWKKVFNPQWN